MPEMAARNVSVLALYNDQKEILLQHRSKDSPRLADHWAFFGGGIEGEETPEQALAREIYEELEYPVSCPRIMFIQTYTHKENESTKYVFVEKYNPDISLVQHEGQDMRWWKFDELNELLIVDHDRIALAEIQTYLNTSAYAGRSSVTKPQT
ncbi:MAG: NUDIX domain-containing protein [Rhodomicrobium sp.]